MRDVYLFLVALSCCLFIVPTYSLADDDLASETELQLCVGDTAGSWSCTCICKPKIGAHLYNPDTKSKFYKMDTDSNGSTITKDNCGTALSGDECIGQNAADDPDLFEGVFKDCAWKFWPAGSLECVDLESLTSRPLSASSSN